MSRFVLDCSVTMAWCFEDEADSYADAVLGAFRTSRALVPPLWPIEVANVLLVAERRRRLRRADIARFLDLLTNLAVEVVPAIPIEETADLLSLGREHRLSAYDSVYLRLAMRERLPLATRDGALRIAARAVGITLFSA